MRKFVYAAIGLVVFGLIMKSVAQPTVQAPPTNDATFGVMHFETRLGSFKIIDGQGQLDFDFRGTVLISQHKPGKLVVTGNVRKEIDERGRQVYFGQGRISISGSWRGIQWFGRDMKADWNGAGTIRMVGEFDKDLNTGVMWYDNPAEKEFWPTYVMERRLPNPRGQSSIEPVERGDGEPAPAPSNNPNAPGSR